MRIASILFAAAAAISVIVASFLALMFPEHRHLVVSWNLAGLSVAGVGLGVLIRSRDMLLEQHRRD